MVIASLLLNQVCWCMFSNWQFWASRIRLGLSTSQIITSKLDLVSQIMLWIMVCLFVSQFPSSMTFHKNITGIVWVPGCYLWNQAMFKATKKSIKLISYGEYNCKITTKSKEQKMIWCWRSHWRKGRFYFPEFHTVSKWKHRAWKASNLLAQQKSSQSFIIYTSSQCNLLLFSSSRTVRLKINISWLVTAMSSCFDV